MIKKALSVLVFSALLSACNNQATTESQSQNQTTQAASQTSTITLTNANHNPNWQTLIVGSQLTYPPFHYQGEKGVPMGFEMELLEAVAKAGEFNITVQNTPRTALEQTLNDDSIQIWSSTISINPERAAKMDFSQPFMHTDRNVLVLLDNDANKSVQKPEDFKGKTIAVNEISKKNQEIAEKITGAKTSVAITKTYVISMSELFQGKVDAVLDNELVLMNYIKNQKDISATRTILVSEEKKDYAFAVKKGNADILAKINSGLEKIKADGTYQKLVQKWFGQDNI